MLIENVIHLGDCLELMKEIPTGSVDMVLCDLPYGTTQNKWDSVIPLSSLWLEYRRVCKNNAAVVLTSAQPFTSALVASNLKDFKYEWVWKKSLKTNFLNAKKQPLRQHENLLVFYRAQPVYKPQGLREGSVSGGNKGTSNYGAFSGGCQTHTGYPSDVLEIANGNGENIHPTQKPVALFEYLINTYTNSGHLVLDSCSGSGTTAVACKQTGRRFVCIEKDETYWRKSVERLGRLG